MWLGAQRACYRPTGFQPVVEGPLVDAGLAGPLTRREGDAFMRKPYVIAPVVLLLLSCCPATVFRSITVLAVLAVEGVLGGRAAPHVREEVLVATGPKPSRTDRNTAIKVDVMVCVFLAATALHQAPRNVLRGGGTALPMRSARLGLGAAA